MSMGVYEINATGQCELDGGSLAVGEYPPDDLDIARDAHRKLQPIRGAW